MKQRLASLLGALVLLTGAVMIGCKQQSSTPTYKITLNVSENGTVEVSPKLPKDGKVPQYTVLTFTAKPNTDYETEWAGAAPDAGDKNKAMLTVTADATVSVAFKKRGDTVKENKEKIADVSLLKINVRGELVGVTDKNALEGKLTIPDTVRSIKNQALSSCIRLTDVIIPQSVISIGYGAFSGCVRLTHINIPDGVHNIESDAFAGCADLTRISIGKGLSSFADTAFRDCPRLSSITVDPENETYCSENNIVYSKDKTRLMLAAPASVTGSFTIPDGIVRVGSCAFSNCVNLTSVTIPASVNDLSRSLFEGCARLRTVNLPSNTAYCSIDNIVYKADKTEIVCVPEGLTGTVTLPNELKKIRESSFRNCAKITGVSIGADVTVIYSQAFENCSSLKSITINAAHLGEISWRAFNGCTAVTNLTIGAGVTAIDDWSRFSDLEALSTVRVDPSNTTYCSIDNIVYKADKTEIVYVPEGLTGEVTLLDELTKVENGAFQNRTELTGVTIGTGVTAIGSDAFANCSSLGTVIIKSTGLTNIVWDAFNNIKSDAQFTVKTAAVKTLLQTACHISEDKITVNPAL